MIVKDYDRELKISLDIF